MPGDETGRRPKFVEGDIERASKGRRHQRPASAPIVDPVIEDDVTPLPQEPPDISQLDGFTALPAAAQRALMSIHNVQREHDIAFGRLWDSRHVHADVQELREVLAELRPQFRYLANVHSAMDVQGKQLVQIVSWIAGRRESDKKLSATLESLDKRLDTIEGDFREMKGTLGAFGRDIAEGFRRRDAELVEFKAEVEERFDEIEAQHAAAIEKIEADHKAQNDAYEKRIRSLEDTRLSARAQAAVIATLIALLGFLLNHYWK